MRCRRFQEASRGATPGRFSAGRHQGPGSSAVRGNTVIPPKPRRPFFALLLGGLQNAGEQRRSVSSSWGAIAAPVFARPGQGTDGALADIVGGIQPRTIKKGEEITPLMQQMLGKSTVGLISAGVGQHPIQL